MVLVSKSQGLGAVRDELLPHIGKTYVIVYHLRRSLMSSRNQSRHRNTRLPYTAYAADGFEGAVIQEVKSS